MDSKSYFSCYHRVPTIYLNFGISDFVLTLFHMWCKGIIGNIYYLQPTVSESVLQPSVLHDPHECMV